MEIGFFLTSFFIDIAIAILIVGFVQIFPRRKKRNKLCEFLSNEYSTIVNLSYNTKNDPNESFISIFKVQINRNFPKIFDSIKSNKHL